jgi:hypothetical protein
LRQPLAKDRTEFTLIQLMIHRCEKSPLRPFAPQKRIMQLKSNEWCAFSHCRECGTVVS